MSGARALVALVAFLLELAALVVLGRFGWRAGSGLGVRVLLAVLAPGLWVLLWGLFFSPHPTVALPAAAVVAGRIAMFGLAALALAATGHPAVAAAGMAVAVAVQRAGTRGRAHAGPHPKGGKGTELDPSGR